MQETDERLEDPDDVGRKVSALFLAQVDEKSEDEKKSESKKAKEEQKKGFLEKIRAKKGDSDQESNKEEKLFEKQVNFIYLKSEHH